MVEEILPGLFRIEIPLPQNPLKSLNSYVVISEKRNLIVDTGFNRKECEDAMMAGLDELGIDLNKTDIFITHLHADHFGLVSKLASENSAVYFNRFDIEALTDGEGGWEESLFYVEKHGFPKEKLREALQKHPGYKYASDRIPALSIVKNGDVLTIGDYNFRCVETPGHTHGHTCLYEPDKKVLIAGDHILIDITPNIACWRDSDNPLQDYLESLEKVYHLDIRLVLPGHRRLIQDHRKRIEELRRHHQHRADEILVILENGAQNAFQVASRMTWDIDKDHWDEFPVQQQWFATGEAIAHLRYLEERGEIVVKPGEKIVVYSLAA
jgi:glyoxylase-like metal-dependent hydrolase (beta-lactamase superfamily II)